MIDKRLDQLANILVNHSVKVQSGDWVMVHADLAALPLVEEVVRKVLRAGGKPSFLFSSSAFSRSAAAVRSLSSTET